MGQFTLYLCQPCCGSDRLGSNVSPHNDSEKKDHTFWLLGNFCCIRKLCALDNKSIWWSHSEEVDFQLCLKKAQYLEGKWIMRFALWYNKRKHGDLIPKLQTVQKANHKKTFFKWGILSKYTNNWKTPKVWIVVLKFEYCTYLSKIKNISPMISL